MELRTVSSHTVFIIDDIHIQLQSSWPTDSLVEFSKFNPILTTVLFHMSTGSWPRLYSRSYVTNKCNIYPDCTIFFIHYIYFYKGPLYPPHGTEPPFVSRSYSPHDSGSYPPYDSGSYPPHDSGSYPPYDSGSYPPYDSGSYPPYDSGSYPPHDSGSYPPYDSGSYPPHGSGQPHPTRPIITGPMGSSPPTPPGSYIYSIWSTSRMVLYFWTNILMNEHINCK